VVGVTLMLIVPTGTLFSGMAAKNKFKGRGRNSISREDADLRDLLGLHFQACRRAEEVEEQIQELHAAGKFPEARVLRMHALGIEQGLRAIEAEVRAVVRPAKYPRPSLPAARQTTTLLDEPAIGLPPPGSMLAPTGGLNSAMLAPSMLSPTLLGAARSSLGADFETTMDSGVTLEVTR